jgi:hypothetical protein
MIVYNVTVSIDPSIENDWLEWMKEVHISEVMATGHFRDSKLCRVNGEEQGGLTYAITYTAFSQKDYDDYEKNHSPKLQFEHSSRYGGKFAAFRTLLTVVEEF